MAKKQGSPRRGGDPSRRDKSTRSRRAAPGLFKLADELLASARAVVVPPSDTTTLARFDEAQLERGIEAVEAIILLLERGHWTFASGIARQLFEQLVNVEYIGAQPDRLEAVTRYAKYGLM